MARYVSVSTRTPLTRPSRETAGPCWLKDFLVPLTNAKVFSVVDAKKGFWHVQLDDDRSVLTTFGTPMGQYRWTLSHLEIISPAPEEFQRRLDNVFQGLNGVMPIFDDTLVYDVGKTEKEVMDDHDRKFKALTLNPNPLQRKSEAST